MYTRFHSHASAPALTGGAHGVSKVAMFCLCAVGWLSPATAQEKIHNFFGQPGSDITSVVTQAETWHTYAIRDVTASFSIVRNAPKLVTTYFKVWLKERDPGFDEKFGPNTVCIAASAWTRRADGRWSASVSTTFRGISEYYGDDWRVDGACVIQQPVCPPKLGKCGGKVKNHGGNYEYSYTVANDPDLIAMDPQALLTSVTIGNHVISVQPPLPRGQAYSFAFTDSAPPPPDDDPSTPVSTVPCVLRFSDNQSITLDILGPGAHGTYLPELPTPAQDYIGLSYNNQVGATSRGSLGTAAGEVMTRLDGGEHAGWGTDTPGARTIVSLYFVIQDQDAVSTAETFDIVLYPEDPANPDFPDLSSPIPFMAEVPGPDAPTSGVINAAVRTITPASPAVVPLVGGGDVFVSFVLPAANWPNDGLSVQVVLGYQPNSSFLVWDDPGLAQGGTPPPSPAPWNSHGLSRPSGGSAVYNARRHHYLDVGHSTSGGVGLSITNQTSYPASNNPPPAGYGPAPGTADMMSGSNPDIVGGNPGRADDIAMEFYRSGIGSGALVVYMLAFDASFGPEVPLSAFAPGSTGVLCLNPGFITLGIGFTSNNEAFRVTSVPASARSLLAGLPVKQQAIAIDFANVLHASPCDGMVF